MPFTLRVVFSGPCLFVQPTTETPSQVVVLMPDARERTKITHHWDEEPAEHHVGFIRINLADVRTTGLTIPMADSQGKPAYEILYRFDCDVLEFVGIPAEPMEEVDLKLPDFECFAPTLGPVTKLFSDDSGDPPPPELLMRTILKGGKILSKAGERQWKFSRLLAGGKPQHKEKFASYACWERTVPSDRLTLRVSDFKATRETLIPLGPFTDDETITVEIANLCAYNPLEWKDLPVRQVMDSDEDFKWLYRLLEPSGSTYPDVLKGAPLPAPRLVHEGSRTGDDDCMGAKIKHDWIPLETVATAPPPDETGSGAPEPQP
jgi:hypothetical protein